MRRTLTAILVALVLFWLWQMGWIREYEHPCGTRYNPCLPVEAAAAKGVEVALRLKEEPLDIKRLCRAIAVAETSNCTTGSALSHTNCHGITKRSGGYMTYESFEESFAACEDLWSRLYVRFPDLELAAKWSSPGAAETWLKNVTIAYRAKR